MCGGDDRGYVDFVGIEGFEPFFTFFLFGEEGCGVCHCFYLLLLLETWRVGASVIYCFARLRRRPSTFGVLVGEVIENDTLHVEDIFDIKAKDT